MQHRHQAYCFEVFAEAERLYLASRHESGRSKVFRMTRVADGVWQTKARLEPGVHRLRYYRGGSNPVEYLGPAPTVGSIHGESDAMLRVTAETEEAPVRQAGPWIVEGERFPCDPRYFQSRR